MRLASEQLNVAQSAISRRIQALEKEIGAALFVRTSRGVVLSDFGERLLTSICDVSTTTASMMTEIAELRRLQRGHVRVAAVESVLPDLLPSVLQRYLSNHPNITFDVTIGTTPTVMAKLRDGEADIGIAFSPEMTPDLRYVYRSKEPLLAVMAAGHPLAAGKNVTVREVTRWPLALQAAGSGLRTMFEAACSHAGSALRPALETNSLELLLHFAMGGSGVSLLLRHTIQSSVDKQLLVARRFSERSLQGSMDVIVQKGRVISPASEVFISAYRNVFEGLPRRNAMPFEHRS